MVCSIDKKSSFKMKKLINWFNNLIIQATKIALKEEVKKAVESELANQAAKKLSSHIIDPSVIVDERTGVRIRTERIDGRDSMNFHLSKPFQVNESWKYEYPGVLEVTHLPGKVVDKKVIDKFFQTGMVKKLSFYPFRVWVNKPGALDWSEVIPKVADIIFSFYPTLEDSKTDLLLETLESPVNDEKSTNFFISESNKSE